MAYDKNISTKKGVDGGLEGSAVVLLTMIVVGFLKRYIMDMDPITENTIATLVGMVVAGALLGLTRAIRNWLKHKNDGASQTPPQTQPEPEPVSEQPVQESPADDTQPSQ